MTSRLLMLAMTVASLTSCSAEDYDYSAEDFGE